ncbi:MAG TPA: CCA tRNA nucleotidyltransferase [Verrucomicrobiae bacterium]
MTGTSKASTRKLATEIVRRLQAAGFSAFWVGGCVRDFLLGREPEDYDIATSAVPGQIEALFKHTVAVGRRFGVIVVVEGQHQFQVATFRAEEDYRDGRRPEKVSFGDARADALRRDFTVNGLFYDPIAGKLHDWVGGEADLRAGVIRTIGVPEERFAEDHLRLLRAVRFAARLGFGIEPQTFAAIQRWAPKIKGISAERVRDELIKLFALPPPVGQASSLSQSSSRLHQGLRLHRRADAGGTGPHPKENGDRLEACPTEDQPPRPVNASGRELPSPAAHGLELLRASGLLEHVLPEVAATIACEQSPDFHPEGSVFAHLVLMLRHLPPGADPLLPWAVLLHDVAKPLTASRDPATGSIHFYEHEKLGATMATAILERLRFPRKQIESVAQAVRYHMQFKDAPQMRKATLRRLLLRPTFPLELALHRLDCLGSHGRLDVYDFLVAAAEELKRQPQVRPPLLTGHDLIQLGLKPGPALGRLLAEIREKQLQDELRTKAAAKRWVQEQLKSATAL